MEIVMKVNGVIHVEMEKEYIIIKMVIDLRYLYTLFKGHFVAEKR
jgi:hypothetical protein